MKEVAIVTDSTCCIPQELIERYDIHLVPLLVIYEGKGYRDKIDITPTLHAQFGGLLNFEETRSATQKGGKSTSRLLYLFGSPSCSIYRTFRAEFSFV